MTEETPKSDDNPTVFFSYSREDQAFAVPIIDAIRAAGFAVWYDGMLEPGVKYLEKTEETLLNARAIVVLWSPRSIQSNWVRDEAMVGRDREAIIPLSIEGAIPPLGFRQFQATDVTHWADKKNAPELQALIRQLRILHDREVDAPIAIHTPSAKPTGLDRRWVLALGAGALLGGGAIASQLFRPAPSTATLSDNGIVVLSFDNLSGDQLLDYIPIGISAELRAALMRNAALRVVAQRTSDAIKRRQLDATSIANELGVSFILDGSLSLIGDTRRLSLELIDGATGFSQWAENYTAGPESLLLLQEQIITEVLRSITDNLGEDDAQLIGAPSNPAAYDQYLRGLDAWRRAAVPNDARAALTYFNEAVRLDPSFAAAHATRGLILSWLSSSSANRDTAALLLQDAIAASEAAITHGPDLADAHSTLGWVQFFSAVNIAAADEPFERSYALGQGNAAILARYATYGALVGKFETAEAAIARAIRLDPMNPYLRSSEALVFYYSGNPQKAEQSARDALEIDEALGTVWYRLGVSKILDGDAEAALDYCEKEPNLDLKLTCRALAHANLGQSDQARAALAELVSEYGEGSAFQQAQILAQLGDLDGAMATLRAAQAANDPGLVASYTDPMLAPLRARDEFSRLLSEIGFSSL